MISITKKKIFFGTIIAIFIGFYNKEIRASYKTYSKAAAKKYLSLKKAVDSTANFSKDTYFSFKTIKGLNKQTLETEKILHEINPAASAKKGKQEYLGTYNRRQLDSLIRH